MKVNVLVVFGIVDVRCSCDEMLACCVRPGGELKPSEDQLEGLKRLLNEVCCSVSAYFTAVNFCRTSSLSTCVTLRQ